MLGVVKVLGGVLILRGIAAAHLAALQAHSQMHPGVAGLDALFADVLVCPDDFDLIEMRTLRHRLPLILGFYLNKKLQFGQRVVHQVHRNSAFPYSRRHPLYIP